MRMASVSGWCTMLASTSVMPYAVSPSGVQRYSVLRSSAGLRAATYQSLLNQSAGGWLFNQFGNSGVSAGMSSTFAT